MADLVANITASHPHEASANSHHSTPVYDQDGDDSTDMQADDEESDEELEEDDDFSSRSVSPVQYAAVSRVSVGDRSATSPATASDFSLTSLGQFQPILDVCTSCGSSPVPSFVALIPCDHLLCHQCVNALINSAAHKPPRPMDCFACGQLVKSFGPAFAGPGGMVDALRATLAELTDVSKMGGTGSGKTNQRNSVASSTADERSDESGVASIPFSPTSISSILTQQLPVTTSKGRKGGSAFTRLQDQHNDSGVGTPDHAIGLSPLHRFDWSEDSIGTPKALKCMSYTYVPTLRCFVILQ